MHELTLSEQLAQAYLERHNHISSSNREEILQLGLPILAHNASKGFKLFQPIAIRIPEPNEWFYNFKRHRGAQSQPNNPVTTPQLIVQPLQTVSTTYPGMNIKNPKNNRVVNFDRWANGNEYGSFNSDDDN